MKRISKEVKIGLAFLISLALLYFGVGFMKGSNVFSTFVAFNDEFFDVFRVVGFF